MVFLRIFLAVIFFSTTPLVTAQASSHRSMVKIFSNYQLTTDQFVHHLIDKNWDDALTATNSLIEQSAYLLDLGKQRHNSTWTYYANNLYNHCLELSKIVQEHNGVDAVYIVTILLNHIGQIQSSNPRWLRSYLNEQINLLEQGFQARDRYMVRNAAEIIHSSADKIILSVSSSEHVYRHTYWKGNIAVINRLGDAIIGEVNQGNWQDVGSKIQHIKHIIKKWSDSFYPLPEGELL